MKKRCTKCHQVKPLDEFHKDKRAKNGHGSYCKSCNIARARYYYSRTTTRLTIHQEARRRRDKNAIKRNWVIRLYKEGLSTRKIAEIVSASYRTIFRWVREAGISRDRKDAAPKGEKHQHWKGGRKRKCHHQDSCEYRMWRTSVYERDSWTCVTCGEVGGELHAHHILSWVKYPYERYNIKNGVTLCKNCHQHLHYPKAKEA